MSDNEENARQAHKNARRAYQIARAHGAHSPSDLIYDLIENGDAKRIKQFHSRCPALGTVHPDKPVITAVNKGQKEVLRCLVEDIGNDPNEASAEATPAIEAIMTQQPDMIHELDRLGYRLYREPAGFKRINPIRLALEESLDEIVDLLTHQRHIGPLRDHGEKADRLLMPALRAVDLRPDWIRTFAARGIPFCPTQTEVRDLARKMTDAENPLIRAAGRGHFEVIDELLAIGVDPNANIPPRSPFEATPLDAVTVHPGKTSDTPKFQKSLEKLLAAGADPARSMHEKNIYVRATSADDPGLLETLASYGHPIEQSRGHTVMVMNAAIENGASEVFEYLLDRNIDPDGMIFQIEDPPCTEETAEQRIHRLGTTEINELYQRYRESQTRLPGPSEQAGVEPGSGPRPF